ncbi:hypothetical protein BJ165DRAFT_1314926, partial [Panaeolus papilionaceus]
NTPIERLWVELGRRFCRAWRVFFRRLGRLHNLNMDNPIHRWLLDYLFLDMINEDCRAFVEEWNAHPMRNKNSKSPNDLEIEGMIKYGVYDNTLGSFTFNDECEGLKEEEIDKYYRYPKERAGSGDEADSDDDELNEEADGLHEVDPAADVDPNIRHEAVSVPSRNCPFTEDQLAAFKTCIEQVHREGHLPHGYGVRTEEWEDDDYPQVEELPIGHAQRCKVVHLPNHVWMARSVLWTQALCLIETSQV